MAFGTTFMKYYEKKKGPWKHDYTKYTNYNKKEENVKMILAVGDKRHNKVEFYDLNVEGWERAGDYIGVRI